MKYHKILVAVLLMPSILYFLLMPITLTVSALDLQNELIEKVEKALDISVFYQKETDRLIKCFDVNDNGCYAIGYKNNSIHLYDAQGAFQYGYRFNTDGTYGIVLKDNSIVIYLARSGMAVEIDSTGKCIDAKKVYFSNDVTYDILNRTHKQIECVNYYLERDIGVFNGDYSRLVKIDEMETKTVLYDVTIKGYFVGVLHYAIISIFPIAVFTFIFAKVKKEKQESDG